MKSNNCDKQNTRAFGGAGGGYDDWTGAGGDGDWN